MTTSKWLIASAALAMTFSLFAQKKPGELPGPGTETIYSIAHVKPGMETQYAALSAKTWAIYRKLDLVLPAPHVVVRGVDSQNLPFFVEIFTWKSADVPDHAPAEVRAAWQELENACEKRNGRPGIDFTEVTAVAVN
ncbi:MAG TPA: hypothetical protein VMB03_15470 [Bryobacteraceae bacterium]|nr:hypothetical protein [Bryobacteraceae bacterium]